MELMKTNLKQDLESERCDTSALKFVLDPCIMWQSDKVHERNRWNFRLKKFQENLIANKRFWFAKTVCLKWTR